MSNETLSLGKSSRESRNQETRASQPVHQSYGDQWDEPLNMDTEDLPPRPGFVQRRVRIKINGQDDFRNISKQLRKGWRPRQLDTVPTGYFPESTNLKLSNGHDFGNVVGNIDEILMEMPEKIFKKYADEKRQATRDLQRAVDGNMWRDEESRGFRFDKPQRHVQVQRGAIADDD